MVTAGEKFSVLHSMLDMGDPFEVDPGNAPHLIAHGYTLDDALDVLAGDPEFYVDVGVDSSADWLLVGSVPGNEVLVVPLVQSQYSGYSKVRPIAIMRAPEHIEDRYCRDRMEGDQP